MSGIKRVDQGVESLMGIVFLARRVADCPVAKPREEIDGKSVERLSLMSVGDHDIG